MELHIHNKNRGNKDRLKRILIVPFIPFSAEEMNVQTEVRDDRSIEVDTEPTIKIVSMPINEQATSIMRAIENVNITPKMEVQNTEDESYLSVLRKLVNSTGLYALSSIASPLVALLLSPFLTRNLFRSEYGALAILLTFVSLLAGITQLGLSTASVRAYTHEYESKRDRLDVLSTLSILLILVSICISTLIVATAPWLSVVLFNSSYFISAIRVSAVVVLLQNLTVPGLCWLRAEGRAGFYSTISLLNILLSASATIIFVGILHMGINGAILAPGTGYAVIIISTLPVILLRAGFHLRSNMAKSMLSFGFPHVMNFVSGWILQLLDRYLLGLLGSLAQVASYAVAYNIGGALSALVISPFSLAWWVILYSVAKRKDAQNVFRMIFRWFVIVLLFSAYSVATLGVIILDLFFPLSYHSAAPIIPIVALSMIFNGINVLLTLGISLKRKIRLTSVALASSAVLNAALNFILIPSYGALGAALATLIAYIALALISGVINQWLYPVPLEIGLFLLAMSVGIALYLASIYLVRNQQLYEALGINIACIVLYGGCLVVLGMLWSKRHKRVATPVKETPVT
jgi:O-antigen/teichoic acid export membrane protein